MPHRMNLKLLGVLLVLMTVFWSKSLQSEFIHPVKEHILYPPSQSSDHIKRHCIGNPCNIQETTTALRSEIVFHLPAPCRDQYESTVCATNSF